MNRAHNSSSSNNNVREQLVSTPRHQCPAESLCQQRGSRSYNILGASPHDTKYILIIAELGGVVVEVTTLVPMSRLQHRTQR